MDLDEPLASQLQVHVLTGVTGGASVSSAAAVAAKCVPGLGAAAAVLAVVWNTPGIAEDTAEVKMPVDWSGPRVRATHLSRMAHMSRLTLWKEPMRPCSTALRSATWSSMWIICMQPWKERCSGRGLEWRK